MQKDTTCVRKIRFPLNLNGHNDTVSRQAVIAKAIILNAPFDSTKQGKGSARNHRPLFLSAHIFFMDTADKSVAKEKHSLYISRLILLKGISLPMMFSVFFPIR